MSAMPGSADFQPDGSTDHLFQNYWWYRIGGQLQETAFSFPADSESYVGNVATLDWSVSAGIFQFRENLRIQLNDGGSPDEAIVQGEMTITNNSGGANSVSLLNCADLDVSQTVGSDSATIAGDMMTITDGTTGDFVEFEGVGANTFQVTAFPILVSILNDGNLDNLNNTRLPFGPGDSMGVYQRDFNLAPGQSQTVVERIAVNSPVPEPATMLILGGALAALAARRRTQ